MASISKLDKQDQPREKLMQKGASALSDKELLMVIIGSGVKGADVGQIAVKIKKLIDINGYILSLDDLTTIKGVSTATATKLLALFELAQRKMQNQTTVNSAQDAVALVPELKDLKQEHLVALYLDGANRLILKQTISIGTLNSSLVHPREVFADAVANRAASIIIIHNHPSSTLEPSKADIVVTQRLKDAGKLLGINLIDHLIITKTNFYSFTDDNRL